MAEPSCSLKAYNDEHHVLVLKRAYRIRYRSVFWLIAVLVLPVRAMAWGSEGHRIVAEIAEQYLEPNAAEQVSDLLAIENSTSLPDIANWADRIQPQRRETAAWHFVDIPVSANTFDPARDCPEGDCVVAKIDQFATVLRDRRASPEDRLEALKFVVHFVGDLQQPLHASDNGDRNGNEIRVTLDGHRTNLYAVWDSEILAQAIKSDERAYALRLVHDITPAKIAAWQAGGTIKWANESHAVAVSVIYGRLPHDAGKLPADYEQAALPIVNDQLERAGVHLARVLNRALGQ